MKAQLIISACLFTAGLSAQDLGHKAPPQAEAVVIENAALFPVTAAPIARGWIHFEDGVIRGLGEGDAPAVQGENVHRIDVDGAHVYPGMISAVTTLGLVEISAVRATDDISETGDFTPEVRSAVAINPDSTVIPVTRSNGVLSAGVFPSGGLVPGRASVISLDGWTWEDMAVSADAGLVVNWPASRSRGSWRSSRRGAEPPASDAVAKRRASIDDLFADARRYLDARAADPTVPMDIRLEAMRPAITGETQVYVRANDLEQIESAVAWADRQDLPIVIVGGRDAYMCSDLLVRSGVPVILTGTHQLPSRRDSDYDAPFRTPALLEEAGVTWCLASTGNFYNERNLPYHAATAVAFGLSKDAALRSVTLSPAEILGVGHRLGSLDVGKSATLFVAHGDPLLIQTHIDMAFIHGRRIDLKNKQTELAEKYIQKYRQLGIWPDGGLDPHAGHDHGHEGK